MSLGFIFHFILGIEFSSNFNDKNRKKINILIKEENERIKKGKKEKKKLDFKKEKWEELIKIFEEEEKEEEIEEISIETENLISSILNFNLNERPTIDEIIFKIENILWNQNNFLNFNFLNEKENKNQQNKIEENKIIIKNEEKLNEEENY